MGLYISNTINFLSAFLGFLNGQFVSAFVAVNVGIFGVWLTIHCDKQAGFKERLDQIKPALSIRCDTACEINNCEKEENASFKELLQSI